MDKLYLFKLLAGSNFCLEIIQMQCQGHSLCLGLAVLGKQQLLLIPSFRRVARAVSMLLPLSSS